MKITKEELLKMYEVRYLNEQGHFALIDKLLYPDKEPLQPQRAENMAKNPVKERNEECGDCNGTGVFNEKTCIVCGGKGYKPKAKNMRS